MKREKEITIESIDELIDLIVSLPDDQILELDLGGDADEDG